MAIPRLYLGVCLLAKLLSWGRCSQLTRGFYKEREEIPWEIDITSATTFTQHAAILCSRNSACCGEHSPVVFSVRDGNVEIEERTSVDGHENLWIVPRSSLNEAVKNGTVANMTGRRPSVRVWQPYEPKVYGRWVVDEIIKATMELACDTISHPSLLGPSATFREFLGQVQTVPWTEIKRSQFSSQPIETHPDVHLLDSVELGMHLRGNTLTPLADLMEPMQAVGFDYGQEVPSHFASSFGRNDRWYALPLVNNYRVLLYNKTTLHDLNLPLPPPHGMELTQWTWDTFGDYLKTITDSGRGYGLSLELYFAEELQILSMIGRSTGGLPFRINPKLPGGYRCGFSDKAFVTAIDKTFGRYFREKTINPKIYPEKDLEFQRWEASYPNINKWKRPFFYHFDPSLPLTGFRFSGEFKDPNLKTGDIGEALVPGGLGAGGGVGVAMAPTTPNRQLAWRLITLLVDPFRPYVHHSNAGFSRIPPYLSSWRKHPWNSTEWHVHRTQAEKSLALYYPNPAPEDLFEMLYSKPVLTMLQMMRRGNDTVQATDTACQVINYQLLPICDVRNLNPITDLPCDPRTNLKTVLFDWDPKMPCRGQNASLLPKSVIVKCTFIGASSTEGIAIYSMSLLGVFSTIFLAAIVWFRRDTYAIKASSPVFCLLILFGCFLIECSGGLYVGWPSQAKVSGALGLFLAGEAVLFSALNVKLYRIAYIYLSKRRAVVGTLSDLHLALPFILLVAIELLLVALIAIFNPFGAVNINHTVMYEFRGKPHLLHDVTAPGLGSVTDTDSTKLLLVGVIWEFVLIISACLLSAKMRRVPSQNYEARYIWIISMQITTMGIILFPIFRLVNDQVVIGVVAASCSGFSLLFTKLVFFGPKLFQSITDPSGAVTYTSDTTPQPSSTGGQQTRGNNLVFNGTSAFAATTTCITTTNGGTLPHRAVTRSQSADATVGQSQRASQPTVAVPDRSKSVSIAHSVTASGTRLPHAGSNQNLRSLSTNNRRPTPINTNRRHRASDTVLAFCDFPEGCYVSSPIATQSPRGSRSTGAHVHHNARRTTSASVNFGNLATRSTSNANLQVLPADQGASNDRLLDDPSASLENVVVRVPVPQISQNSRNTIGRRRRSSKDSLMSFLQTFLWLTPPKGDEKKNRGEKKDENLAAESSERVGQLKEEVKVLEERLEELVLKHARLEVSLQKSGLSLHDFESFMDSSTSLLSAENGQRASSSSNSLSAYFGNLGSSLGIRAEESAPESETINMKERGAGKGKALGGVEEEED